MTYSTFLTIQIILYMSKGGESMQYNRKDRGFTLIEILVVLSIISTLFMIVVPQVNSSFLKSKEAGIRTDFRSFQQSSESYLRETLGENIQIDGLNKFLDTAHRVSSKDSLLQTKSNDPWNNPYEVALEGTKIRFASLGAKDNTGMFTYQVVTYVHQGIVDSCTLGFTTQNLELTKIKNLPAVFTCGSDITTTSAPSGSLQTPSNFVATSISETSATLSWQTVLNASNYILQRNGVTLYTGSNTLYSDITLSPGITYNYTVSAKNSTETSSVASLSVTTSASSVPVAPETDASTDPTVSLPTEKDGSCFVIRTVGQLQAMNKNRSACFILGNNIDASGTIAWNSGKGFAPISGYSYNTPFTGSFDGKGHTIKGLYINRTAYDEDTYISMFGCVETLQELKNVTLDSFYVVGGNNTASLSAGCQSKSITVKNVTVKNVYVKGKDYVAGLSANKGTFENIHVDGSVIGGSNVGGIMDGTSGTNSTIKRSSFTGRLEGTFDVGGLCGRNCNIEESFVKATVKGSIVGLLIGTTDKNTIQNSYGIGKIITVNRYAEAGGLAGSTIGLTVQNVYLAVDTSDPLVKEFLYNPSIFTPVVTNSYFDLTVATKNSGAYGTGKPTSEMKKQATYAGWNFTDIWGIDTSINNGYPYLRNAQP